MSKLILALMVVLASTGMADAKRNGHNHNHNHNRVDPPACGDCQDPHYPAPECGDCRNPENYPARRDNN